MQIEFTQASRRHKVGRARVRQVLAKPVAMQTVGESGEGRPLTLYVGDDLTGRALEVIVVEESERLVVIHAMDLRPKFRPIYEQGRLQ